MEWKSRKRNSLTPISHQLTLSSTLSTTHLHLPDDCWESIFKFCNQAESDDIHYLMSLSLVSKQFFSITNRIRFSLTICDPTETFLRGLFKRFTNLTSLNLTRFRGDLNKLLCQIALFPLNITSLNLSNKTKSTFPFDGLLTFSKKITTLTSLTYSNMYSIDCTDSVFLADCFPLLEELNLSNLSSPYNEYHNFRVEEPPSLTLFKLRKVRLEHLNYINDQLLFHLFNNCKHLEEAIILNCYGITDAGIASALSQRPTLRSLSLSGNPFDDITHFIDSLVSLKGLTFLDLCRSRISDDLLYSIAREGLPLAKLVLRHCYDCSYAGLICFLSKCHRSLRHLNLQDADFLTDQHVAEFSLLLSNLVSINLSKCKMLTELALFALLRNCASLGEIKMERIWREEGVENPDSLMDFGVYPQLKSLYFANNPWLSDESIIKLASIVPNLQVLDLRNCRDISDVSICPVLRCCKIRYLNLTSCSTVKLHRLNFEVSKLEWLILSMTKVDDGTLNAISRNCCGLLHLKLRFCYYVTEKGVNHVIERCTQLRKIDLVGCSKLHNNIVDSMLYSRPSIRKIRAPYVFDLSDRKKKLFLQQGCILK